MVCVLGLVFCLTNIWGIFVDWRLAGCIRTAFLRVWPKIYDHLGIGELDEAAPRRFSIWMPASTSRGWHPSAESLRNSFVSST